MSLIVGLIKQEFIMFLRYALCVYEDLFDHLFRDTPKGFKTLSLRHHIFYY